MHLTILSHAKNTVNAKTLHETDRSHIFKDTKIGVWWTQKMVLVSPSNIISFQYDYIFH